MTQFETLKMMYEIVKFGGPELKVNASQRLGEWSYDQCLANLEQMIKVRTKTPEQREKENARKRQRNAEKRVKRDAEITAAITPYLNQPRTASELVGLTNHAFKVGEIRSYFDRHFHDFEPLRPRSEWAYQIKRVED